MVAQSPPSAFPFPGSRQEPCSRAKPRDRAGLLTLLLSGFQLTAASPLPLVSQPTPSPAYTPIPSLPAYSFPVIPSVLAKSHPSCGLLARFWSSWAIPATATVQQPGKVDTGLRDKPPPQGGDGKRRDKSVQGQPHSADRAADTFDFATDPESCQLFLAWTTSDQETEATPNQLLQLPPNPSCN